MKSSPDNLDAFALRLAKLAPSTPSEALARRLEAALSETSREMVAPRKVIQHPFAHRVAAAMVAAMLMAFQSTRSGSAPSGDRVVTTEMDASSAKVQPVYQQVNGRLVPISDESTLRRVKYRGMDVIDGRPGRIYRSEREVYFQPFLPETSKSTRPVKDVENR